MGEGLEESCLDVIVLGLVLGLEEEDMSTSERLRLSAIVL